MEKHTLARIDHLVFASPDLDLGIAVIEATLGIVATPGGRHPGFGTRNALVALGSDVYLEIIAPDPESANGAPQIFGLDEIETPSLAAWAVRANDIRRMAGADLGSGLRLGAVARGGRMRPDGGRLDWTFTDPRRRLCDGLIPFLIDWGDSPHPARELEPVARLVDLHALTPDADKLRQAYDALELDLAVTSAPESALVATIDTAGRLVELR